MSPRPPGDFPAESGVGEPSSEELQALDAFLDALAASTPEPVPAAASVDPALAAMARRLDRLPPAIWESAAPLYQPPAPVVEIDRRSDGSRRRLDRSPARRLGRPLTAVAWTAAAAAVVVVLAVVGINTFSGQPPTRPVTGVSAVPATWRLAGFIDQAAWQATPSGALSSSVGVTCPAAGTCYADDPGSGQGSAVVEVTTDGGTTWTGSSLPAGSWVTSNLTCPTVGWCLGAGDAGVPSGSVSPNTGTPATFVTTDGGTTWLVRKIPGVVQSVAATCGSPGSCVVAGLGAPTAADPEGPALVVRTADGGGSWSVAALPSVFSPARLDGLSCTASGDCVVVGTDSGPAAAAGTPTGTGAALYSSDGGATWASAKVPAGLAVLRAVSCPTSGRCLALGNGPVSGAVTTSTVGPSQVLSTDDGGRSWQLTGSTGLVSSHLGDIFCSTATDCRAAGFRQASASAGSEIGTVVATVDGGRSWTTDTLPTAQTPAQRQQTQLTGLDIENVSAISCVTGWHCIAVAAQGSSVAPTQQHLAIRD